MKIQSIHVDFYQQGGMKVPVDLPLFQMVDKFAKEQLAEPLDICKAVDVWAVCRTEDGKPVEVLGIAGWQQAVDVFLFRIKQQPMAARVTKTLWNRLNDFFADRGCRGGEVLLFISESETDEQRCPQWKEWLTAAKAKAAQRKVVVIR